MNTDTVLLINIAMLSLSALVLSAATGRSLDWVWIWVHGAIIAFAALAFVCRWEDAGYLLLAASLVLVIAPVALMIASSRIRFTDRAGLTVFLSGLAAILHPSRTWRFNAALTAASARSSLKEQCQAFERLETEHAPDLAVLARLYRLRSLNDWQGLLDLPLSRALERQAGPLYIAFRIMALGELGRLDDMVSCYFDNRTQLAASGMTEQALLSVLVFAGKYRQVDALFATPEILAMGLDENRRLWISHLARLAAGQHDARPILQAIAERMPDPMRRLLMERRLDRPMTNGAGLRSDFSDQIDREAADILSRVKVSQRNHIIPVTVALIVANLAGYIYEMQIGSSYSVSDLVTAGGMWPDRVLSGEWWRLATALFLHVGPWHLIINLVALYIVGDALERRLGLWRTLVVYAVGGVLSSAFVCWLMVAGLSDNAVLVGASGAVFAMFGALAFIAVADWLKTRAARDRALLVAMALVIVLQALSDFILPGISFAAHFGGFCAGCVIGAIFVLFRR